MAVNLNDFVVQQLVSGADEAQVRKYLVENQGFDPHGAWDFVESVKARLAVVNHIYWQLRRGRNDQAILNDLISPGTRPRLCSKDIGGSKGRLSLLPGTGTGI